MHRSILNIVQEKQDEQEQNIAFLKNELRQLRQQQDKEHRSVGQLRAAISDTAWGLSQLKSVQDQLKMDVEATLKGHSEEPKTSSSGSDKNRRRQPVTPDDTLDEFDVDDTNEVETDIDRKSLKSDSTRKGKPLSGTPAEEQLKAAIEQLSEQMSRLNDSLNSDRHLLNEVSSVLGIDGSHIDQGHASSNRLSSLLIDADREPIGDDRFIAQLRAAKEFIDLETRMTLLEETASGFDREFHLLTDHLNGIQEYAYGINVRGKLIAHYNYPDFNGFN